MNVEIFSSTDFLDLQNNNIDIALRAGRLENSSYKQRKMEETSDYDNIEPEIKTLPLILQGPFIKNLSINYFFILAT